MSTSEEGPTSKYSRFEALSTTKRVYMAGNTRLQTLLQTLPPLKTYLTAQSLQTFTVFPRLPLELRSRIWRLVAVDSRVIKLVPYNLPTNPRVEGQSQHPSMLHASRESRREGMRHYRKCLQKCCDIRTHSQNVPCGKPRNIIYVNFKVDRFRYGIYDRYVANDGKMAFDWKVVQWGGYNFQIKDMVRIKRLEIELYCSKFPQPLEAFRNLKHLRDNVKFEECTFLVKRWNGLNEAGNASFEDSYRTADFYSCMFNSFDLIFKHYQEHRGLDFAVRVQLRSKGEWRDLPPGPSVLPTSSKETLNRVSARIEKGDGEKIREKAGENFE